MDALKKEDGESLNIVNENIEALKRLVPDAFSEDGIDFDAFRLLLGEDQTADGEEKYGLSWNGKKKARQLALTPSTGTLLPCYEESVHWETTQNLFIEGDNLEVLKLLQRSYANNVKLIYIDPPYNTGNEFIYPDKFQDNLDTYLRYTGQIDDEGFKMSSNTEAGGRKHTNWLNMMYPRLKLSHRLLRQDGIFMCSIGDDEHGNLKKICDDIFGEENFISSISRLMKSGGAKGTFFTPNIDYVLIYAKDKSHAVPFRMAIAQDQIDSYYNKVEAAEGSRKGERYGEERLFLPSLDIRPNQRYWIECPDGSFAIPPGVNFPETIDEGEKVLPTSEDKVWRWTYDTYKEAKDANRIIFKETDTSGLVDQNNNQCKYNIYFKLWLKDQQEKGKVPPNFLGKFENRQSSAELKELKIPFDFAKPVNLLRHLIEIVRCDEDDIILDFFAGSASTAHAVLKRNVETDGSLRWICVQLPEKTPESSEAEKAGYKTISDIGKERARRAADKLKKDNPSFEGDLGFKVFKLASSNIREWNPDAADLEQTLLDHAEHLVEGRSEQDVLYELLLKRGVDLTVPIEEKEIAGKTVYSIGYGVLFACLDETIDKAEIEVLAKGITNWCKELEPAADTQVVFRDSAFADDIAKTNMTAILEQNGIAHVRSL